MWFNISPFLHSLPPFLSPLESITLCRLSYVGRRPPVAASRLSPRTLTRVRLVLSASKQRRVKMTKMQNFFRFPPSFKITLNESMQPHFIIGSGLKQVIIE